MLDYKIKNFFFKKNIINLFFCLIPLSFIIGNFVLNINLFLLLLFSLFFFKREIFLQKKTYLDYLILLLFSYLILVLVINLIEINFFNEIKITHFDNINLFLITKNFFFFRYLIFYFIIQYLVEKDIIKFKNFFLACSFLCFFVSIDIIYQFIFNKDIFGLVPAHPRKLSGPFGSELIAGSYLQKFFLFFISLIICIYSKKNYLIIIFVSLNLFAIILSGNRMPLILSILSIAIYALCEIKIRKILLSSLLIFTLFFSIIYSNNSEVRYNFANFKNSVIQLSSLIFEKKINRDGLPSYFDEFESFYDTWQMNKYFGGSIRSFRIFCPYRKNININERSTCNTHPHNYYLEILTDIGLIGLFIIIMIFFTIIKESIRIYINKKYSTDFNYVIITPFLILFLIEIFPLKSTGSFFSTWNSTFIFLLLGSLSGFIRKMSK